MIMIDMFIYEHYVVMKFLIRLNMQFLLETYMIYVKHHHLASVLGYVLLKQIHKILYIFLLA